MKSWLKSRYRWRQQDYLIKAIFGTGVLRKTLSFAFGRFRLMRSKGIIGPQDQNQALWKEALTLMPNIVFHCSEDLIIDFQSKARHDGESASQCIWKHIEALFPADQHALIHDQISRERANQPKEVVHLQWQGPDEKPINISCQATLSNNGGCFFVIVE